MENSQNSFEFEVTWFDAYKYGIQHYFTMIAGQVVYILLALIIFLSELFQNKEHKTVLHAFIFSIFAYALMWVIQAIFTAFTISSKKNRSFICKHFVRLEEDELFEQTSLNRTYLKWEGIEKVKKYFGCLAIYATQHGAITIPDRYFKDKRQKEEIYRFIKSKIAHNNSHHSQP